VECPSCGRANASDRVECNFCEALLVDVFQTPDEKTDPMMSVAGVAIAAFENRGGDSGNGFTRPPESTQYTGDLPRLFRFGNRYQILEKLGEGGMGRVYKALDLELDRPIALKTIRAEKGQGPEILKRFKQELILARKITHKNVVRIYDLGEAEGMKFFTMELVDGESLRDILREKKRLPVKEAISFMRHMLSGLAEAHGQGVVHRDLKPQNIMVDSTGALKIMDFGIARTADTATLTGSGEMMGTPDYISPEQVKGETAGPPSDLYSCGVILYELLTGEVPFKGDTPISKIVARIQVKPLAPRTLNSEIPGYLERIVLKLMEVDPDLRYKTAPEVLQDLEREQVDRSLLLRTRKALARRKGLVAAASLVGALAIGWYEYSRMKAVASAADVTTIAILPFHNMMSNAELGWMEHGIPEMLITDVSQSLSLRPLRADRVERILDDLGKSGQTSFDDATLKVIADFAKSDWTLHGEYSVAEGKLRLDLSLRETTSGVSIPFTVWTKSTEVFSAVDTVTERLSTELDATSFLERNRPFVDVATKSLDAYQSYQSGLTDLQQGRNQSAIASFEKAVSHDPTFAMAHARLAEAHWNLLQSNAAKESIQTARSLDQALPLADRLRILAIAARIDRNPDSALDAYNRLNDLFPSDPEVMLELARAREDKGDVNGAIEKYKAVIDANPGHAGALMGLGRMLVTIDRSEEAIPILERAAKSGEFTKDPESLGMLHSILGVAYRSMNQHERAIESFEISLEARRGTGDQQGVITTLVNLSIAQRKLRRFDQAASSLMEALAAAREAHMPEKESFALLSLGNVMFETGRLEEALDRYRESLDIQLDLKQDNELAFRLDAIAEVYRLQGRYIDALVYLERAKALLDRHNIPSEQGFNLIVFGQIEKARGDYDEAIQALLKGVPPLETTDRFRDLASARRSLADVYVDQGRYVDAFQVINKGLEFFEKEQGRNLATMRVQYAEWLFELGDYASAEEQLDLVEKLVPTLEFEGRPHYYYIRGRSLAIKRAKNAQSYLSRAADESARGGDAFLAGRAKVALGRLLAASGESAAARRLLADALHEAERLRHPRVQAESSIALAECEMRSGKLVDAERRLDEAKSLATRFEGRTLLARADYHLGSIARMRGDDAAHEAAVGAATKLVQWMTANQVPPEYRASFLERWPPQVDVTESTTVERQ
jgi:eukaryotic-like serine/threonine-protein kinase